MKWLLSLQQQSNCASIPEIMASKNVLYEYLFNHETVTRKGQSVTRGNTTSLFEHYDLSVNGFVPESNEVSLPEVYQEWEQACRQLPTLINNKTLPAVIEQLPLMSVEELVSLEQKKHAYLILCMMGNGYLWMYGRDPQLLPKKLPENIAYPWFRIAASLGLKPILTHAAVDLYNVVTKAVSVKDVNSADDDNSNTPARMTSDPDELDCRYTLTGTQDEKWFYLIMSAIEIEGSKGVTIILELLLAVKDKDDEKITEQLQLLANNIKAVEVILKRTLEKSEDGSYKCDPKIFWNQLRIYLGGTADPSLFPDGLEFESSGGSMQRNQGGSAAQSSLIQLYDAVLGVVHVSAHTRRFLLSMRDYMPQPHRQLLEDMEATSRVRDYVMMRCSNNGSSDNEMMLAFEACINSLTNFRKYHYYIVQRYIIDNLPEEAKKSATGTGGTSLTGFLLISKDETSHSSLSDKDS